VTSQATNAAPRTPTAIVSDRVVVIALRDDGGEGVGVDVAAMTRRAL
jgi:hypothetical protein